MFILVREEYRSARKTTLEAQERSAANSTHMVQESGSTGMRVPGQGGNYDVVIEKVYWADFQTLLNTNDKAVNGDVIR